MENRLCKLLDIQYPIIAGGMVWCSGWRLASAVSNAGGLGLIGAGSMHPDAYPEMQGSHGKTFWRERAAHVSGD